MKFNLNLNLNIVAAVTVTLLGAAVYYKYTTPVEEIKTDKGKIDELVQGEAVINNVNSIISSAKAFFINGEGM